MALHRLKQALTLASLAAVLSATAAPAAAAEANLPCAFVPIETLDSGELVTGEPVCFPTLAEAIAYGTGGAVQLPPDVTGPELFAAQQLSRRGLAADPSLAASAYDFDSPQGAKHYAIHYTGDAGTGASATVFNIYCTGNEYWNATGTFWNSINSTYNACDVTTHYDKPNMVSPGASTYGRATIDTLPSWFKDRTESARYYNT